jgi:hypothetical protein
MADEITLIVDLDLVNGVVEHDFSPNSISIDQSTARFVDTVLDIGTSAETISFGDIATKGVVILQNLDSTNYVTYGPDSTGQVTLGRLNAGEIAVFRIDDSATLKATADTATCKVRFIAYEN